MLLMASNSLAIAERIHREVNVRVKYWPDAKDEWRIAGTSGDCEDYALAKRQMLLDAGWSVDKQALCICKTGEGVTHAVLMVDTDAGVYILDNLHDAPVKPSALKYEWMGILWKKSWRRLHGFLPE